MIEKGIIYSGRWEIYFRNLARIIKIWRPMLLMRLFNCNDVDEQARIWRKKWDNPRWRTFLRCISSKIIWKYIFGDPGFYQYVPPKFSIFTYLVDRFNNGFGNILVRESPFARLLLLGKYDVRQGLPLYLQKKYYITLKDRLSCIQIVNQSLVEYLAYNQKNRFHAYSLSDFASYTNIEDYEMVWEGVVKTASNGAHVCERQFLVKREIPLVVEPYTTRIKSLENELTRTDDSLFYTFVIARIEKN
jgi:S-adenosylmethionine-diacylglycerol 3-amino-3-carboxypropyl transferase